MRKRSPRRRITGALAIALAALFAMPALAQADLLQSFTAEVRDQNGNPYTQAGGHPFEAFTDINFDTHDSGHGGWGACATHDGSGPYRTMAHGDTRIAEVRIKN